MATTRDYEPNVVLSNQDYNVVGTRPLRPDGADKVTGRALYGADFAAAGLLSGSVLRSPHAHARIKSIDTSKAEALDGVRAVVTSADFPQGGEGPVQWQRDNVLASDKALYRGHAIAAVAAASPHIAEEAVSLIDVDYEVLTPVTDVQSSMKGDAPILHDSLMTDELGEKADKASNVASHFQHVKGDVEAGFKEADVVIEREFTTKTVHQGYIEPQAATALWNNDGRLHIWCSTQGSFAARDACARILDIPVSQIRVVPLEIGGGFGGKIDVYLEPVAALLSKKTGTPVKLVMSRADVLQGTGPTPGSYAKIKTAQSPPLTRTWQWKPEHIPARQWARGPCAYWRLTTWKTRLWMATTLSSTSPRPLHTEPPALPTRRLPASRSLTRSPRQ